MLIRFAMAIIVAVAGLTPAAASVANTIIIRETAGAAVANAPIQIGRAFVAGEVPNFPRAVVAGTPVTTQADVKCRWSDGSVKHAVISFMLPSLSANASVSVAFVDQASGNNTAQTQAQMLAPSFDFDAVMRLTSGGTTVTASGRAMLANGDYTTWARGPIATTVVLADHSTTRRYDLGFDANRSFRPIVHATFWPTIGKVHVRFIGEAANTTAMQDLNYAVALSVGSTSPQNVYSKASVSQGTASRWTKDFWIGGAPPALAIDHNLAYLVQTYALPNYDTTKSYSGVAAAWNNWNSAAKDLYGAGNWTIYMPTTGGRADIAIYPDWTLGWLYTFDPKMQQVAFGQADLAAAWPVHFREGSALRGTATRFFDRARTVSPVGRPLSINARPTFTSGILNWYINSPAVNTDPLDYVTVVGPWGVNPWEPEVAHMPDPFTAQYLLSGDFFYLEEMQFWASFAGAKTSGGGASWSRGPTGAEGGVQDQIRGDAWTLRSRARTAWLSPDGSPEKSYFTILISDALALWEGQHGITGTALQSDPSWVWGNTVSRWQVSPLRHWSGGDPAGASQDPSNGAVTATAEAPWQYWFLIYALGEARQLGYPAGPMHAWFGQHLIGELTDPGYDPHYISAYRIPVRRKSDGAFFQTWAETKTGFLSTFDPVATFNQQLGWGGDAYIHYALAAASTIADLPGGSPAWDWMATQVLPSTSGNPKWAILPRAPSNGGVSGGTTTGGTSTGGTITGGTTTGTSTGGVTGGTTSGGTTTSVGSTTGGTSSSTGSTTSGTSAVTTSAGTSSGSTGSPDSGGSGGSGCGLGGGLAALIGLMVCARRGRRHHG